MCAQKKNTWIHFFLFLLGCLSLVLGVIGVFIPLLPTTPFLILTAACFLKSSPEAHAWLYRQPTFGPVLRDWETRGAISRKTKTLVLSMLLVSSFFLWTKSPVLWMNLCLTGLFIGVSIFILTRPE